MKWLSTKNAFIIAVIVLLVGLVLTFFPHNQIAESNAYYRITVLSDLHLPVREEKVKKLNKQEKIMAAKNKALKDINSWDDVKQVVVLGDIAASTGSESEYAFAVQYFSKLNKPISFVTGNHDYLYEDFLSSDGKRIQADADTREAKLKRFKETFGLSEVFYSQKVGKYLLIFLSVDSLKSHYLTQISERQLMWLRHELANNPTKPTIIFFHAPLKGTLSNYSAKINGPNDIAQPEQEISEILSQNKQVFLWVSGHTHTPVGNPDFASPNNVFAGRITNIHNTDMDKEDICTNSIYLYPDKVVVKTFDHKKGAWINELERTILPPNL